MIYWLQADADFHTRRDRGLNYGRYLVRHRPAETSLNDIYENALTRFNGNIVLAAEVLRRAIDELATPTVVDDSFPADDSPIWKNVRLCLGYFQGYSKPAPQAPRYRDRLPRSRYFE